MEENAEEKERRSTETKTTILEKAMQKAQNDLGTAQTAANTITNKMSEKQKKGERQTKIKKYSDIAGIVILIGLAIYMSISLIEQDLNNGITWLFLGLSCGAIGSTAIRLMRKKKEEPNYERYNVQIVNGHGTMYPDVLKHKMVKSLDEGIVWANGEAKESQSWRIMDIMDGKIVKTLEGGAKKH